MVDPNLSWSEGLYFLQAYFSKGDGTLVQKEPGKEEGKHGRMDF